MFCNFRDNLLKIISCSILMTALSDGFRIRNNRHKNCSLRLLSLQKEINKIKMDTKINNKYHRKHKTHFKTERFRRHEHPASLKEMIIPLPPALEYVVKNYLNKTHYSFTKKEDGVVELSCNSVASRKFFHEFESPKRRWVLNNHPLEVDGERMIFEFGKLIIESLKPEDQGVYLCRMEFEPGQLKTVGIFSLIVDSKRITIRVKKTLPLRLQCNSAPIGYIFPTAKREWKKDGKLMKSNIDAIDSRSDVFPIAKTSHEGYWMCSVSHKESKRTWKTALYRVHIDSAPTVTLRFLTFIRENPVLVGTILMSIFGFVIVIWVGLTQRAALDRAMERMQLLSVQNQLKKLHERQKEENKNSKKSDSYSSSDYESDAN